jgi:hypothetical protein
MPVPPVTAAMHSKSRCALQEGQFKAPARAMAPSTGFGTSLPAKAAQYSRTINRTDTNPAIL